MTKSRPPPRRSLSQSLSTNSMFFGIPTTVETKGHTEEEHGEHSWRYKVVEFLHTPIVQKTMMALLVTDILLLFLELFLLATYPHCSIIERDGLSCIATTATNAFANATDDDAHHDRWLAGDDSHHGGGYDICKAGYDSTGAAAGCDSHKWSSVHTLELYVFSLTVVILSIFFLELTVEMVALTPRVFFCQFWFLLDYVIISISLALEVAFRIKQEDIYQSFVGLLVVVRIWRFVRIGHGIVEVTHENVHNQGKELLLYVEELEELLKNNGINLPRSAKHIHEVHHDHAAHLLETIEERAHSKRSSSRDADISEGDENASSKGDDDEEQQANVGATPEGETEL